jgi:hypothetical protein
MRKRLEELNWRTLPHSPNNGDHGEAVGVFDSKPGEVISTPVSLKAPAEEDCLKPTEPAVGEFNRREVA